MVAQRMPLVHQSQQAYSYPSPAKPKYSYLSVEAVDGQEASRR